MVCYLMPPLYGGAGAQALGLARELTDMGIKVCALTARLERGLKRRETVGGVQIHRLGVPAAGPLRAVIFSISAAMELIRRRKGIKVVHIHGAYLHAVPIMFIARRLGIQCIVKMSMHGTDDPETTRRRRLGKLLLHSLQSTDAVVSISSELTAAYRKSGLPPGHLMEIPNGADTTRFRPSSQDERAAIRDRLGLPRNALITVFTGAVQRRKGVDTLLRAWKPVSEKHPEALLILVGPVDEMEQDAEKELTTALKTSEHTTAVGFRENVEDYLRASDVFVLPSRMEGLSNSLIEAMACGLPAIAGNISGNTNLIDHGANGYTFETGDTDELARRIEELFDNPETRERMGRLGRAKAESEYSIKRTADMYRSLYDRLSKKRAD
jgi:glycosyltransferase involved in cell wall biosynthesis